MEYSKTREIVEGYYDACVHMDINRLRGMVSESFIFRSPQHRLQGIEPFIAECVPFMQGLAAVRYLHSVVQDDQMFIILEWEALEGGTFVDAELARVEGDRIAEVLIINNDPMWWQRLHAEGDTVQGSI